MKRIIYIAALNVALHPTLLQATACGVEEYVLKENLMEVKEVLNKLFPEAI